MGGAAATLDASSTVLAEGDGAPVEIINPYGNNKIVFVCEHASNRIPAGLRDLGLTEAQLHSHIGWDPGARNLAVRLSNAFDAPLVAARFSRLVYDCNRPPDAPSAMPYETEVCSVPGNARLSDAERNARVQSIYVPFHEALSDVLRFKRQQRQGPVVVTVHTFTPVFNGEKRLVEIGYLHEGDDRLSQALHDVSSQNTDYDVRLNEPYAPRDGVLHTVEKHLQTEPFPYVMIEVRNDLLTFEQSFEDIVSHFAEAIPDAASSLDHAVPT